MVNRREGSSTHIESSESDDRQATTRRKFISDTIKGVAGAVVGAELAGVVSARSHEGKVAKMNENDMAVEIDRELREIDEAIFTCLQQIEQMKGAPENEKGLPLGLFLAAYRRLEPEGNIRSRLAKSSWPEQFQTTMLNRLMSLKAVAPEILRQAREKFPQQMDKNYEEYYSWIPMGGPHGSPHSDGFLKVERPHKS